MGETIYPDLDAPMHSASIHSELDRLRELERIARSFADAGCEAFHMSNEQFCLYGELQGFFRGGLIRTIYPYPNVMKVKL